MKHVRWRRMARRVCFCRSSLRERAASLPVTRPILPIATYFCSRVRALALYVCIRIVGKRRFTAGREKAFDQAIPELQIVSAAPRPERQLVRASSEMNLKTWETH